MSSTINNKTKIYAFYEKINDQIDSEYQKIIELWKNSWIKNGWEPIILNLNDSKKHPDYESFYNIIKNYPSIHNKEYIDLCYLRWLAIANIGGWYTDVDMINIDFKPIDFNNEFVTASYPTVVCPSTIYMPKYKYEKNIIDILKNYNFPENHAYDKNEKINKGTSDMMIIFNHEVYKKLDKSLEIQCDYNLEVQSQNFKIVHFHGGCLYSDIKPRSVIIKNYLDQYEL